ncbi:MAG TPA: TetR/AcrR family transcriptional regulator [Vicinamibacteria bacterium]|nr:TetR/AcrR family transcriptional regulator [Vicinamibacteria bacterium]
MSTKEREDRRVRKTRDAVVSAFNDLVRERRYEDIRVGDIVSDADVGRSTFYQYYTGKEDVLVESMGFMLDALASAASTEVDPTALEGLLSHFWENRSLGRELFSGPQSLHVAPRIARALAQRIEARIASRLAASGGKPLVPPRLLAIQTAEAELALIRAWLMGMGPATPSELAEALTRSARAMVEALLPASPESIPRGPKRNEFGS